MPAKDLNDQSVFEVARNINAPEARNAYLQQACGDDSARMQRIVALLEAHQQDLSFLESPPLGVQPSPTVQHVPMEQPGTQIGSYKLLQQIGEGGMGVVWMAEQDEPVRRKVALKIIKPGMDTWQVVARFEAERQTLAMMDHPNIAKVFDGGATESSRPYFVMELVRGIPITKYCDEHHLTLKQRLELLIPVCQAVQHAHQKGVIHRDLKPNNVLVAQYDDRPVPKVIDFGVAKAAQKQTDRTMFTEFGQVVGTLEYMSPEQARFNELDIDTRSDIYSLGVLLYELLTSCTPFDGKRLRGVAFDEMLRIIREEEPPKPSTRLSTSNTLPSIAANRNVEPARLGRDLRGELDWIVMKAMEKDRNLRYETANGFAQDLQRYLSDLPVQACPPSAAYRVRKFVRRNKGQLLLASVLAAALLVAVSGIGWAVRDRAANAQQIASQRVARQAKIEQKVGQLLREIDLHYRDGNHAAAVVAVQQGETTLVDDELSAELTEPLRRWRDDLRMVAELEKIRLERATLSEDAKWDWSGADRAYERAFRNYGLSLESRNLEKLERQIKHVQIAVEVAIALDDWVMARRELHDGDEESWRMLVRAAQVADPDPLRNKLRSLWGRNIPDVRDEIDQLAASSTGQRLQPTTIVLIARLLRQAKLTKDAELLLREGQEDHPDDFWINLELADYLAYRPRPSFEDALGYYRAALAVRPDNVLIQSRLGYTLGRLNRTAEAERAHFEAIRLSPKFGFTHATLGDLYRDQGQWPKAIAAYEEAIRVDPEGAVPYPKLANILTNCPDHWRRDYRRAEDIATKGAQLSPNSAWAMHSIGWAQYRLGRWQDAINSLEKSCQLQNNGVMNGDSTEWFFLAMANHQLGRTEAARRWYDRTFQFFNIWKEEGRRMEIEAAQVLGIDSPPERFFTSLAEANTLYDEQRWQEAIDAYSVAITLAPVQAARTWRNRGRAYLELQQWEAAVQDLTKSLEINPEIAESWQLRGRALALLGQTDRAIADFTRAIEIEPHYWEALENRGLLYMGHNQWKLAQADWLRVIRFQPDQHQKAFDTFRDAQRWVEAAEFGMKLIKRNTASESWSYLPIAGVLVQAEDRTAYAELCGLMLERFQDSDDIHDAERVTKACLLWPHVVDISRLPANKLTNPLDDESAATGFKSWGWATRALLAYRSDNAKAAVEYVAKSEEFEHVDVVHALNLAILALAQHQLRNSDEARSALEEASKLITRLSGDAERKNDRDLLIAEIVFHEATKSINSSDAAR